MDSKLKIGGIVATTTAATVLVMLLLFVSVGPQLLNVQSQMGIDFETASIHGKVTMLKDGELYFQYEHPGVVTDIGDNMTLYWAFNHTNYAPSSGNYMSNISWISIGDQGSLSSTSTQLPGEWNRTFVTTWDNFGQSYINATTVFYPDNGGPYTADCIGLNWASSGDNNLWGYDTFSEVTGIDETFTITVEFQISVAHS